MSNFQVLLARILQEWVFLFCYILEKGKQKIRRKAKSQLKQSQNNWHKKMRKMKYNNNPKEDKLEKIKPKSRENTSLNHYSNSQNENKVEINLK